MPIYEFECTVCKNIQEELIMKKEDIERPKLCNKCKNKMKRVMSLTGKGKVK
jgi:putative FmdB family regulatory protein